MARGIQWDFFVQHNFSENFYYDMLVHHDNNVQMLSPIGKKFAIFTKVPSNVWWNINNNYNKFKEFTLVIAL